jgi:ABC-type polysaccharide/polyol phosphate transport system ATPase subunit
VSPQAADSAPAVVVERVSKRFSIPQERVHTLKERVLHPVRRTGHDDLQALRDVSFAVQPGEFFGIVGRNGSGKSTLLKCMAGIYRVDEGQIYVNGRVATFIELGVGFNPDLVARDNIMLNAVMLGLQPSEAKDRVDRVIEFAELQQFTDLKLKNYSSGMHVRLAFSVMIQVDADILLIDEVLAVGDAAFQQKCFDEFHRLREEKKTILFVTHDMPAVRRFCHRAMLLERGEMLVIDEPERVTDHYIKVNFPQESLAASVSGEGAIGDQDAVIVEAWFEEEQGTRHEYLPQGRPCSFRALVKFNREVEDPSFALMIRDDENRNVFGTSTIWTEEKTGRFGPGDQAVLGVTFENLLAPGRYFATVQVARRGGGQIVLDRREQAATFVSTGSRSAGGVVELPHDVEVRRPAGGIGIPTPAAPREETKA